MNIITSTGKHGPVKTRPTRMAPTPLTQVLYSSSHRKVPVAFLFDLGSICIAFVFTLRSTCTRFTLHKHLLYVAHGFRLHVQCMLHLHLAFIAIASSLNCICLLFVFYYNFLVNFHIRLKCSYGVCATCDSCGKKQLWRSLGMAFDYYTKQQTGPYM